MICDYYNVSCCLARPSGACDALRDRRFADGICHFRKLTRDGENLYDKMKREKELERKGCTM